MSKSNSCDDRRSANLWCALTRFVGGGHDFERSAAYAAAKAAFSPLDLVLFALGLGVVLAMPCRNNSFRLRDGGLFFPGRDKGAYHFINQNLVLRFASPSSSYR